MADNNEPIKQHWVPQSYLRYFRDPSTPIEKARTWLFKKDKAFRSPKLVPVSSIFYERHLYTLDLENGEKHYGVEHAYGEQIDAKYPRIINKIEQRLPINNEEHQLLCMFMAAQLLRTPRMRDAFVSFMNRISDMSEDMAAAHGRALKTAEEIRKKFKDIHTINTVELIPEIAKILHAMNIAFACAPATGKRFITSDNPVFIRNPDLQWQYFLKPGLGQENIEVYFPASPTTLAILCWKNYRGYVQLKNKDVSEMNRWIQGQASDWFIAPSKKPELYWFSRYPADPFFIVKIIKFRAIELWEKLKRSYAKR